jgi:hypothetical protein
VFLGTQLSANLDGSKKKLTVSITIAL